jgi:outer membrane usher protein
MRLGLRSRRAEPLLAAVSLACGTGAAGHAAEPSARLVLTVAVDGEVAPEPLLVRREGKALWVRAADLRTLGIAAGPADTPERDLKAVKGISVTVDDATQTLSVTRTAKLQQVSAGAPADRRPVLTVSRSSWGAAMNYDVTASRTGRASAVAGLFDATVQTPSGFLFGSALASTGERGGVRRLDVGFTAADPISARRLTIGDLITGATDQSRPIRLGGVQVATDFDLRPDLVTHPLPTITGSAAVPSALDLIVNGARRSAGALNAGRFAVSDVPIQTGVNTITVATRDALGREVQQTVSTYVSRALLRPGLVAYSAEAGLVRTAFGSAADRYRGLAASGSLRRGLTDQVTLEMHGELSGRVQLGSAGASLGLGRFGLLTGAVGIGARGDAHELAVGYERIGRPISMSARHVRRGSGWYDLASDGGAAMRRSQTSLSLSLDLANFGNLGMTFIDQSSGRVARPLGRIAADVVLPPTSLAAANYSVRLTRQLNLVANMGVDLRRQRSSFLSIGVLMVLGRRSSGYAGALLQNGGSSGVTEVQRATLEAGDVGFRLGGAAGRVDRAIGGASYQGDAGFYSADVERINGVNAARVSARGALVLSGGTILAADRLQGSFAVVDTSGQPGVAIYRDNRKVGVTGKRGKLVLPNLRAYEPTRIALDPLLLDDSMLVDRTERWIKPALRAGVWVRFALRRARAAHVTLIDAHGVPIAAGSRATVNGLSLPVGMDGLVYVEAVRATNHVSVQLRDGGRCDTSFGAPEGTSPILRVGPIACRMVRIAAQP